MRLTDNIRLMIVDDHPLFCAGLASLFRTAPNIKIVATANEADKVVSLAEQSAPDVVLMDATLADHQAFGVAERILARSPAVRVVFLDDLVRLRNVAEALRVGGVGYWTKHATFQDVFGAVRRAAAGTLTFCPTVRAQVAHGPKGPRLDSTQGNVTIGKLSPREIEVMTQLAKGLTVKECACNLDLSSKTVDYHKCRLMKKLQIHKAAELVRLAIREGLLAD